MNWRLLTSGMVAGAMMATTFSSCNKHVKKSERELESAGYQLTDKEFLRALRAGDTRVIRLFAEQDTDLQSLPGVEYTPLHVVAENNRVEAAEFLLNHGVDIDAKDERGATPLMWAARAGKSQMLRFLLKQGAKPSIKDHANQTAFIMAVDKEFVKSVEELAPYCRMELDTALLYAAAEGRFHVIDILTSYGASVYTRFDGGLTPLMMAAKNGHTTTVYALLENGSNRYAVDEQGRTAAQIAEEAGQSNIAEFLTRPPEVADLTLDDLSNDAEVEWDVAPDEILSDTDGVEVDEKIAGGRDESVASRENGVVAKEESLDRKGGVLPHKESPIVHKESGMARKEGSVVRKDGLVRKKSYPPRKIPFIAKKTLSSRAKSPDELGRDLQMKAYRQKHLPFIVEGAGTKSARVRMLYGKQKRVEVKKGEEIPETHFRIVSIQKKRRDSKMTGNKLADVSVVVIEDERTGVRRKLTSHIPATASEPLAVLKDRVSGQSYAVRAGQTFYLANGDEYLVADVRPNQVVLTPKSPKAGKDSVTIFLGR